MVFCEDGHLRDEALAALARNEDVFEELERLEIAEHLAFCDECLHRYTLALEGGALLIPEHPCKKALWARIWSRTLRLAVSRYATAAAAVTLALTVLWGGTGVEFRHPVLPEDRPSISRQLTGLTGEFSDSLRGAASGFSNFFDGFSSRRFLEGGYHS